ncbi:MAG: nucleotide exchange factor GrpE [Candidatus Paceibacterota bacterium]
MWKNLFADTDAFEMAMKNKETWESVNENWRKGMEYIFEQLKGVLRNNGVEDVGAVGEKFNPDTHHAIEEIETDDESKDGTVSDVVQKGYKGSKGVIRPAKVKIYRFIK